MSDRSKISLSFVESFLAANDLRELFVLAAEKLGLAFGASKCIVLPLGEKLQNVSNPLEWSLHPTDSVQDSRTLKLSFALSRMSSSLATPIAVRRETNDRRYVGIASELEFLEAEGVLVGTARSNELPVVSVCVYRGLASEIWDTQEIEVFTSALQFLGLAVSRLDQGKLERKESVEDVADSSVCPLVRYDRFGRVTFANKSFCEQCGSQVSELRGIHYSALIQRVVAEADREKLLSVYTSVFESSLSTPQGFVYELQHRLLGTSSKVVDWLGPTRDGTGFESTLMPFQAVASDLISNNTLAPEDPSEFDRERYQRLVEHSDAIIFHCEPNHVITFISRRALDFFGVAPEDFVSGVDVSWLDLVHLRDREIATEKAESAQRSGIGFDEEFRIVNHITGRVRWLLAKLVPVQDSSGKLIGWDGFGIDITARKEAQEALAAQSKRVQALYTVSSAIRGYLDPANISSRGLAALCEATGAKAGVCFLFPKKKSDKLSLVAHHGMSERFSVRALRGEAGSGLSQYVSEFGQTVVVPDIQTDPRASKPIAEEEGLRSAMFVPISVEEEILGALGLFHQDVSHFDGGDVMLASAAANQIGLAARQANLFAAYRQQTKNLSALYRLSHVLSGFLTLEEIFQKSFEVIRDELGFKRLWLGLLDESGTSLVGQSAYGPGWRRRLVQVNFELEDQNQPLAQVVRSKKPVIISDPESLLGDFGARKFFSRFAIKAVGLVPLISDGQVLGILAFQPEHADVSVEDEEVTLILSLASEIARSVRSKRLEEKAGDSEKMRTTGLLAAGIAHNFNNLLQAILGQASLLEMQDEGAAEVVKAAGVINDAAAKGASILKQLMSFANLEEPSAEVCNVSNLLLKNSQTFKRKLLEQHELEIEGNDSLPQAYADPSQILRIILALIENAKEALGDRGKVTISFDTVTIESDPQHYGVPVGEYVRIGVRDNGKGMDAETQRRCFEPFFTTKDVDPSSGIGLSGTGLGLSAAYTLAKRNGGRLTVESSKGRGSLFLLYLPMASSVEKAKSGPAGVQSLTSSIVKENSGEPARKRGVAQLKLVSQGSTKNKGAV